MHCVKWHLCQRYCVSPYCARNAFHNPKGSGNLGKFGKHFNGDWSKERFNILQDTETKS